MVTIGFISGIASEVATVTFTGDMPQLHDILSIVDDEQTKLETIASASDDSWYCFVLVAGPGLKKGAAVFNTHQQLTAPVGNNVLGRAFDVFGLPIDGKPLPATPTRSLYKQPTTNIDTIVKSTTILETGIKAIDFFAPLVRGGKMGLFGGAGLGKTILLSELINNVVIAKKADKQGVAVMSAVGERSREAHELQINLKEANVLDQTVMVVGQMGERPAIRFRTALAGVTLAEYFRDEEQRDVLFFMDNVYRFNQAGMELSTLMQTIPSEDGYQPTLSSEVGWLEERLVSTKEASITAIEAIYLPSDDLNDYGVRTVFPYLDSIVVLNRDIYQQGRLPAVDLVASTSSALNAELIGPEHYELNLESKRLLEKAITIERMVSLVGANELSLEDQKIYIRTELLKNYMTQQFTVVANQTGQPGVFVPLSQTIADVKMILDGSCDHIPPEKVLFVERLEQVMSKTPLQPPQSESTTANKPADPDPTNSTPTTSVSQPPATPAANLVASDRPIQADTDTSSTPADTLEKTTDTILNANHNQDHAAGKTISQREISTSGPASATITDDDISGAAPSPAPITKETHFQVASDKPVLIDTPSENS